MTRGSEQETAMQPQPITPAAFMTLSGTPPFDPIRFKETTREQWNAAARAWNEWGPFLERWLGAATELLLDMTRVTIGTRILDVAAGAGGQTLTAARRAGPTGYVLATDISPAILEHAAANARAARLETVHTATMDGEALEVPAGSFDAAISRVGLIYFPDRARALAGIRTALRRGGRVGAIVYSTPERNRFFSVPVGIIRRRAGLPLPPPGLPGPFSLGAPGVIEDALRAAGFTDVEAVRLPAPLRMASSQDCLRFERESFGALHQMLAGLPPERREEAWREIGEALREFDGQEGFEGPCELVVAAATA
jgi:SAM-dependent methyltransferase